MFARAAFGAVLLVAVCLAAGGAVSAAGVVMVEAGATLTLTVDEEDFDGLSGTTPGGVTYFIWTPQSVDFERLSAFHRKYAKKKVTLTGDVFRDERGLMGIAVVDLPD